MSEGERNGLIKQRRLLREKCRQKNKEIDRLNNIIKDLIKDIEIIVECEDINIIKMQLRTCLYNKLKELKENK